jgi:hypothetical protein
MRKISTALVRYQRQPWIVTGTWGHGLVKLKDPKSGGFVYVLGSNLQEIQFKDYLRAI